MNERLDPEEVEGIMGRIKEEAVRIVEAHGGTVNQFVGDEILALFGIPTAHEDDSIRSVRAALDLHRMVNQLSPKIEERIGHRLSLHTGINTGLVVTNLRDERNGRYGITGDTVNTGSRLMALAGPDEILISPSTHRLIAPFFQTQSREEIHLRGKVEPITPYRVTGESTVRTRFEAAEKLGLTTFTGRTGELDTLRACFAKTRGGSGQFVTIVGEAGLGKSRLLYEFRYSLFREEATILEGRCQSYGSSTPYFPMLNALRRGLRLEEGDDPCRLKAKAVANILAVDRDLERFLPLYLHLLSIPSEEYPLPKHLKGQDLKNAIQDALAAILTLNTKHRPMILILEDWHWVDEASDSALKHLVSVLASVPLMVVTIYRPEYVASWGHWSYHTKLVLEPLKDSQMVEIARSVWRVERIPEGLVPLIVDRTGGNPFFIEEICHALVEEGTVQIREDEALLTRSIERISLPDTIQAVIRARLDRLDHDLQETLRLASVIGREFYRGILDRITDARDRLSQDLNALKTLELIQQFRVVPEAAYMFKHVLTQEVTYGTLLRRERRELHSLVGRIIEELYSERIEEQVELLTRHFSLAEDWPKAVDYGWRAARRAYQLSQFNESVAMFEQTLDWLDKLPQGRSSSERQLQIQLELIWSLHFLGALSRMEQICRTAEVTGRSLNSPAYLGRVFYGYANCYFFGNDYKKAERYYLQILEMQGSGVDKSLVNSVRFPLAVTYMSQAQWTKAVDLYYEVIRIAEEEGTQLEYLEQLPYLPYAHCFFHLAYFMGLQGRISEARELIAQGSEPYLEQASNLQSMVWYAVWHSAFALLTGEDFGALKRAELITQQVKETDSPILRFLACAATGNALLATGQREEAREAYLTALKATEGTTFVRYQEAVYYNLVRLSLDLGDWSGAQRFYGAGLPLVDLNPERETPRFNFLKGRLLAEAGPSDFKQAEWFFEQSIKADEESGTPVQVAQTRYYLGRMLIAKGEIDRGQAMLSELRACFRSWNIPAWERMCQQELEAPTK